MHSYPARLFTLGVLLWIGPVHADERAVFFEKRIRPVLVRHCYECHSALPDEAGGGLRLDSRDAARKGGESGAAVIPGRPESSLLLQALRHQSLEMPPSGRLPDRIISDFETWIRQGAVDPRDRPPSASEVAELSWQAQLVERRKWWSLQPLASRQPPRRDDESTTGSIDAFLNQRLLSAGIEPSGPASSHVLVRRLSLVLTGLPPSADLVDWFVRSSRDDQESALKALVDRLLESPHFGEHWARHWMDVVRFAETHGYEWNHEIRDAWRYRDYLIRAFNQDVPYDQLVREHIAGDLLETPRWNSRLELNESLIGTAFWRFGELGHDDCVDFPAIRFDALDDQIDTLGKAFQGLTISCARCHDHKFDAISTRDYYALLAILDSCSQVVHTLDSPNRIAVQESRIRDIKQRIRHAVSGQWLKRVSQIGASIEELIDGEVEPGSRLAKAVADRKLDAADPGSLLGRIVRREGSNESGFAVPTDDLKQSRWLWYPEGNAAMDAPIETRWFRRNLTLPANRGVSRAYGLFAGDDIVRFYVNGQLLGTGNGHPDLVAVDLTGRLRSGDNHLAVSITNGNPQVRPNPGGWIGVIHVDFDDGNPSIVHSDADWKSARKVEPDWETGDFSTHSWVTAMDLGPAGMPPWGFPWPDKANVRKQLSLTEVWSRLRKEYAAEQTRRRSVNTSNFESWGDFRTGDLDTWLPSGLGLSNGPSHAGEFTLVPDGDRIIGAILPAGLHTNVISDRLNGSLRSPWVPTEKKYISIQLMGDGHSMVRPVVDTCGLNEFAGGGLEYLAGGNSKWKRLPTSAGGAHRSFVELTTRSDNPRWPDRPGRAGTNDPAELASVRSSFSVIRAVLHDSPDVPQADLDPVITLFTGSEPSGATGIGKRFQRVAQASIENWRDERATDGDVVWLNWLLHTGLLPATFEDGGRIRELRDEYRQIEKTIALPRVVAGLADHGQRRAFPVLLGGDPGSPLSPVAARYLEVLSGSSLPGGPKGSGRRGLAEVIASSQNPLTSRVMVNRVWHYLFGRGIVRTPDDFGSMGEPPTHPGLLDYLAAEFVRDGWSVKRLVRQIVLSEAFRRSSLPETRAAQTDPSNRLWHHFPARRLDAESLRDTILMVSGRIDRTLYGPSIHPHRKDEVDYRKLWSGPLDGAGRRSIYTKMTRMEGPQFLELFDLPNPMSARGRRDRSNVPAQALALMNDPFVIDQARVWSESLVKSGHASVVERITFMFRRALGRSPVPAERERFAHLVRALARQYSVPEERVLQDDTVWQDAAHAIFNMKELVYIR